MLPTENQQNIWFLQDIRQKVALLQDNSFLLQNASASLLQNEPIIYYKTRQKFQKWAALNYKTRQVF